MNQLREHAKRCYSRAKQTQSLLPSSMAHSDPHGHAPMVTLLGNGELGLEGASAGQSTERPQIAVTLGRKTEQG